MMLWLRRSDTYLSVASQSAHPGEGRGLGPSRGRKTARAKPRAAGGSEFVREKEGERQHAPPLEGPGLWGDNLNSRRGALWMLNQQGTPYRPQEGQHSLHSRPRGLGPEL